MKGPTVGRISWSGSSPSKSGIRRVLNKAQTGAYCSIEDGKSETGEMENDRETRERERDKRSRGKREDPFVILEEVSESHCTFRDQALNL